MATLSEMVDGIVADSDSVDIILDRQAADEVAAAEDALDAAITRYEIAEATDGTLDRESVDRASTAVRVAQEALADAVRRAEPSRLTFVFQAIGKPAWRALERAFPAGEAQHAESGTAGMLVSWDITTFPTQAMAASMIDPEGATPESVAALEAKLSIGQWSRMWSCCVAVNTGDADVPKSLTGSAKTSSSAKN